MTRTQQQYGLMLESLKKAKTAVAGFWRPVTFTQTMADIPDRLEQKAQQKRADQARAQRRLVLKAPGENSPLLRHVQSGAPRGPGDP